MVTKEELQSQEGEPKELGATEAASEVSQEPEAVIEPGAEDKPVVVTKPPRTYSEVEWRKRESQKDKEANALRQKLAEINMQAQAQEVAQVEREASRQDRDAVAQGTLSESDARERELVRRDKIQVYMAAQRLRGEQEEIAKSRVAQEIAKKYGITVDNLLDDKEIKSPADMIEKAASLSQKRLSSRLEELEAEVRALKEGEPKYDQGQKGTMSEEDSLYSRYPTMRKRK